MDELEALAKSLEGKEDALPRILWFMTERMGQRAGLVDYWISADPNHPAVSKAMRRVEPIFGASIRAAKAAGLCRPDLTTEDIELFGRMLAGATQGIRGDRRAAVTQRAAKILIAGLTAPD
ncbi:hypothetical protein [Tropicimonas isoalkanivorans]|nr:hypothetical protein [Tropicimonas isoalkanivorans]